MLSRSQLHKTAFYNEYLKPQGIETGFGVTIRRDGGCNFLFSVVCADLEDVAAEQAVQTLQAVVPHLRDAFDYYRRHPGDTFSHPDVPGQAALPNVRGIVRLGPGARVLFADAHAVRLAEESGCISLGTFGRFSCASDALCAYVESELANWDGGISRPSVCSFHLRRADGRLPLRVTVYRPSGYATFFRGPECILRLEDPGEGISAAAEEFSELYGMSSAEQRILEALANGLPLEDIAAVNRTSLATVRTQIKHIFRKTGITRQADLVRHICIMTGGAQRPR